MTDLKTILNIEFWIQPAFYDHEINTKSEKFYFEVITEIVSDFCEYDIEDLLGGDLIIRAAMDQLLVDVNNDFGVVKYEELTSLVEDQKLNDVNRVDGSIITNKLNKLKEKVTESKEKYLNELDELDREKEILYLEIKNVKLRTDNVELESDITKLETKSIKSEIQLLKNEIKSFDKKTEIEKSHNNFQELLKNGELTDKNWKLTDLGELSFTDGETLLGNLDLDSLYTQFSDWKIGEDEVSTIKDKDGKTILEVKGYSFYNVGVADIKIYDKGVKNPGLMTPIKGGFFIRKDGSIELGDIDRTRSLEFDLGSLLKIAKKSGTTNLISEIKKLK